MPEEPLTYSAFSESELIAAIKASKDEAFKVIYYRLFQVFYAFLWRKTRDEETAKDLTQELFLRLWKNRRTLDPNKSLHGYLYKVANNLSVDHLRKKLTRQKSLMPLGGPSTTEIDELFDQAELVDRAIDQLPTGQREVFVLHRFEGLKYREISEVLGISVKAVESRMSKAITVLRNRFEEM